LIDTRCKRPAALLESASGHFLQSPTRGTHSVFRRINENIHTSPAIRLFVNSNCRAEISAMPIGGFIGQKSSTPIKSLFEAAQSHRNLEWFSFQGFIGMVSFRFRIPRVQHSMVFFMRCEQSPRVIFLRILALSCKDLK
jgi:hypothetical protein